MEIPFLLTLKAARINKDAIAAYIVESLINDAKINNVFDEYDREMHRIRICR